MADRPCREHHAADHARDADQPARGAHQVGHQPQAQEAGGRLPLSRVLLQDEPGADQQGREQGQPVVEADVDVHGRLARRPAGARAVSSRT